MIRPSDQKLLDQVKAMQLQRDDLVQTRHNTPDSGELQKAVEQADTVLGTPNDTGAWEKLPLAQRAAVDLGSLQVQIASQRRQIQAYELYVKTLQDHAKLVEADVQWQAVVQKNQRQAGPDDPMVLLLNLIRPGLGTTVQKLQDASRQGTPQ